MGFKDCKVFGLINLDLLIKLLNEELDAMSDFVGSDSKTAVASKCLSLIWLFLM